MPDRTDANGSEEALPVFSVRLLEPAIRDRALTAAWIIANTGESAATDWLSGLDAAISSLATLPRRYARLTKESRWFGEETRRFLYQRASGRQSYHIYYFLREAEDGPQVLVVHIRHSARKPLTPRETQEIIQGL